MALIFGFDSPQRRVYLQLSSIQAVGKSPSLSAQRLNGFAGKKVISAAQTYLFDHATRMQHFFYYKITLLYIHVNTFSSGLIQYH